MLRSVEWQLLTDVAVTDRRFGTTYWSHLHGSSSLRLLDPCRRDRQIVPKRRPITINARRETQGKSERLTHYLPHFVCISISSPLSVFSCHQLNSFMKRQMGQNRTVRLFAYRQTFDRPDNYTNSLVRLTGMPTNSAVLPYVNESGVPTPQSALITLPLPPHITQTHSRLILSPQTIILGRTQSANGAQQLQEQRDIHVSG
jgi:hypothetical protein